MLTYIIRRLVLLVPTLIGVTAVVFFVMAMAPGGFGGAVLSQHGTQTEGESAKRIRREFARRYGLDKPAIVQYGRWLNQVSPVGFKTTDSLIFAEADREAALALIQNFPDVDQVGWPRRIRDVAVELARYEDDDLLASTRRLLEAIQDPVQGLALARKIGEVEPDDEQKLTVAAQQDLHAARRLLLAHFESDLAHRNRVLFHRPTIKLPDFGRSLRGRPVVDLLAEAVPITLLLNVITVPLIYVVAIFVGIAAARHRGKIVDVGSGVVLLGLWSIPVMFVGVLLIGFLANNQYLRWFPTGGLHDMRAASMPFLPTWGEAGFERGWLLDFAWHLVLPIFCLTYGGFAVLAKLTRGAILENISADYVRTARAKGLSDRVVLYRHVLRNSLLPLITVIVGILPALFAGAVIVENIFSINGMGKLGVEAAFMKDRELVMGTTLIAGLLGLLTELLRDLLYAVADPRVVYD